MKDGLRPIIIEMLRVDIVTTPISVGRLDKVPSESSASTTIHRLEPMRAFDPQAGTTPPTSTVGSRPASTIIQPIMAVVVVFP